MPKSRSLVAHPQRKTASRQTDYSPNPHSDPAAFTNAVVDKIEMVALEALKPHPRRTRTHDQKQISIMKGSFTEFGFLNPLLIDESNVVLAGDARWQAAQQLGIKELPAVRIHHLSEAEKRAYKIADNRIAELAGWDLDELKIEFDELIDISFNMDVIGFDTPAIDLVLTNADRMEADEPDPADILPEAAWGPAVSRPGDIWLLGRHRIGCGSALDARFLASVMGNEQARLVLTDPPYNVKIAGFVGGHGAVKHREFAMASGEMSQSEFREFLLKASQNAAHHLIDGGLLDGFMDWRGLGTYAEALEEAGLQQLNLCVWDKQSGGMGSLYRSQHELCLIYKKGERPHVNNIELGKHGRYRTNVWSYPGMAAFGRGRNEALKLHPTVKPVTMLVDAILDVTHPGEIVLDTFLGSGSTLLAAERSKRICRGLEIDPVYVDTIINRFVAFTGIEAIHAATGKSFAALKAERDLEPAPDLEQRPGATQADAEPEQVEIHHTKVRVRRRGRVAAVDVSSANAPVSKQEIEHA